MGFHVCEFCNAEGKPPATSSGDVVLEFESGPVFQVPDMLPHYILEHHYQPPEDFVRAVMAGSLTGGGRPHNTLRTGTGKPIKVGYLHGSFPRSAEAPSVAFLARLETLLRQAAEAGRRQQTRGLPRE